MALNTRLFVGNLPDNFKEHALRDAFSSYGEIINFDLKCKPGLETENKKRFAFVTLSATNFNVESCIKYFSNEDFHGNRLYVTRARESFLERLQREREQLQNGNAEKNQEVHLPIKNNHTGDHRSTHKRKFDNDNERYDDDHNIKKSKAHEKIQHAASIKPHTTVNDEHFNKSFPTKEPIKPVGIKRDSNMFQNDEKKQNSDKKRMESMKKKRQEFNEKKNIIKTGLVSIDKQSNKKIIFSDTEVDDTIQENSNCHAANGHVKQINHKSALFDDGGGSDNEINFEVKKQYEGKKGQKVLDLQSRYKSDKRFTLDERFIEDSESEKDEGEVVHEKVDLNQADEKSKQMNILQDVLGVTIKSKATDTKTKLGMLRFDPTQPDHAKFLVPVTTEEYTKKSKKKKSKESKDEENQKEPECVVEKVEVSKEQFYKISDTLKDHNTKTQPTTFSLRSLFKKEDDNDQEGANEEDYIPQQTKKDIKVKNPLDPGEKNPFVYDSSESESEEDMKDTTSSAPETNEIKTVWKEKLFLSITDHRLKDGLIFFGIHNEEAQKERRELKSLMKKRIYNKERKNTMFQKKIGGRKKNMRNKFRKN